MKLNPMVCFLPEDKVFFFNRLIVRAVQDLHKIEKKVRSVPIFHLLHMYTISPIIDIRQGQNIFQEKIDLFFAFWGAS